MQEVDFDETLDKIVARDPRYHRDAYLFVREALDYTHKRVGKAAKGALRHVTGQELLAGIRAFALAQFGPMAMMVFDDWGVRCGEDFGEIVFNMVDAGLLGKTAQDSREDFRGGYDFFEAFRRPFLPTAQPNARATKANPAEV